MGKISQKNEEIFAEITKDLKDVFGADLLSILLYGSLARGEYVPSRSDINFLVVLTESAMENLDKCFNLIKKWRKKNVAIPLFMTKSFIRSSLDSFPIEFLNMKKDYRVIYGEDVFADLEFEKENLLLQCERELKGKTLNLWEEFLRSEGDPARLKELAKRSLTAYVAAFNALLYVRGVELPSKRKEIIEACAKEFGVNLDTFLKLADLVDGRIEISKSEIKEVFKKYIKEASLLCELVDKMNPS